MYQWWNGNLCPINKYELENNAKSNYEQPVKDTCKSLACSNAYVEYANDFSKILDDIEDKIKDNTKKVKNDIEKAKDEFKNNINSNKGNVDSEKEKLDEKNDKAKEGIIVKRLFNSLDQSLTAHRDYIISNKCSTIPATSDATVITKLNTFVIAVVFIIYTLL